MAVSLVDKVHLWVSGAGLRSHGRYISVDLTSVFVHLVAAEMITLQLNPLRLHRERDGQNAVEQSIKDTLKKGTSSLYSIQRTLSDAPTYIHFLSLNEDNLSIMDKMIHSNVHYMEVLASVPGLPRSFYPCTACA